MATRLHLRRARMNHAAAPTPAAGSRHHIMDRTKITTANTTAVVDLGTGPLADPGLQWTNASADDEEIYWFSDEILSAFTLSASNITFNLWGHESNANDNVTFRVRLFKWTQAGGIEASPFFDQLHGTEFGTTAAVRNLAAAPSSTPSFAVGDRIVAVIHADDQGGNATTGTATLTYDGGAVGAAGDSYIEFPDNIALKRTRTVGSTSTPDFCNYASASLWEAAEQADLPTNTEIRWGECRSINDTSACTIGGWTSSATYYPGLKAAPGSEAQMPWDATHYRMVVGGNALLASQDYTRIEQIQVECNDATGSRAAIRINFVNHVRVDGCHARSTHATAANDGILAFSNNNLALVRNCWASGNGAGRGIVEGSGSVGATAKIYNNLAVGWATGFIQTARTAIAKNNTATNCTTDFAGSWTSSENNVSEDATAPGANSKINQSLASTFVGGGDYHLDSGDTVAKGAGVDLSADADFPFDWDFDGETRSAPWDIGPDQIVSSGVTLTVADSLHGHPAESPSLTQANTLALADALHGHSAENVALIQQNTVAVADASHSHSAESPSLTQQNTLTVADALHGHTAESPTLTQANTLAAQDVLHGHAADNVTLESGTILSPADALHAHTAESPALTQANVLAPDDALHAHRAESPTLAVLFVLTVQDSLHGHTADSPAIFNPDQLELVALRDVRIINGRVSLRHIRPGSDARQLEPTSSVRELT